MSETFLSRCKAVIRKRKVLILISVDIVLMLLSIILSVFILMQNDISLIIEFFRKFWWSIPLILAFRLGIFRNFGLYHWAWQYISMREVISLIRAVVFSSLLVIASIIAFDQKGFPFSMIVIETLLSFSFLGMVRMMIRIWKESSSKLKFAGDEKNVLIVGAGDAGEMILREMLKLTSLKYKPIGFVDDSISKKDTFIHHLPVIGTCDDIPRIVDEHNINEIILALPTANHKQIRRIVGICEQTKAKFKIVPGIFELIDGTVHVSQIRDVGIEDLLGRDPITLDIKSISSYLSDSNILVTGAGGSIGSELCRQIAMFNPSKIILLGKGENSIFEIEMELNFGMFLAANSITSATIRIEGAGG